ncbi:MAG: hypothetical protein IPI35_15160 [Deltaproteobacteria bacterium]|nr:hypothetical protein [Deltaproteobacteria bacterium]
MRLLSAATALSLLIACTKGGDDDGTADTQPDNISWADSDGDNILDLHEGFDLERGEDGVEVEITVDTDGDGLADHLDTDTDGDGVPDDREAGDDDALTLPWDTDGDGVEDFRDDDSDGNCILDANEGLEDFDGDGIEDFHDLDDDGDGILDSWEIGADCALIDSDGDTRPDYRDKDADGDGVADIYEAGTSAWEDEPRDTDGDGLYDYLDGDSDGDGVSDAEESGGSEPPRDSDGDGVYDLADTDSDGDGLSDQEERDVYGTSAYSNDTDSDGFSDGAEIAAGTNPKDPGSIITGVYVTVEERTRVENDFTFKLSVQLGDVAFLLDTTGSMSGLVNTMGSEFSTIVSQLSATLPDAQYGAATYDDYVYSSYGSSGDKPFILIQQVTSDVATVSSKLKSLPLHYGGDTPESGMEALYQGLSGMGFDQDCDNVYDSSTDVRPFIASASDAFGGAGGSSFSSSSAGGGSIGGFGFRDYALPILVYATDAALRDPDTGYGVPPACSLAAGSSEVVASALDTGAYLIGITVNGTSAQAQMNDLATKTGSYADTDGDGMADDRLVFNWSTGSASALRKTIVDAIGDLVSSVQFSSVSLQIEGDEWGFVTDVSPSSYALSSSASGQEVTFSLSFRGTMPATTEDQLFKLTLNVLGDGTVLLDTYDIYVRVPGRSF